MSEDFVSVNMQHYYCEAFHAEWKLTHILRYINKKLLTQPFSPLPNLDVKFCFEVSLTNYDSQNMILKFVLIKLDTPNVPSSLKLKIEVKFEGLDGKVCKEYFGSPIITVKEMDFYYFANLKVSSKDNIQWIVNRCCGSFYLLDATVLKCHMSFFDHLENSPVNSLTRPDLISWKVSETPSDGIESLERSDKFSDILVGVGSKLFLAHKAVLAHHSPVLKQMITEKPDDETVLEVGEELSDVFDSFLDYLYSGNFEGTSWPNLRDLYVLSAIYEVGGLKQKCAAAILPLISVDRVAEILKVASDYEDSSLKEPATKFAVEHIRDIISSEEWKEFIVSHPQVGYEIIAAAFI